jgi:hypothetical protein
VVLKKFVESGHEGFTLKRIDDAALAHDVIGQEIHNRLHLAAHGALNLWLNQRREDHVALILELSL